MKSKGYLRFYNRLVYFDVDLEMVDVLLRNRNLLAGKSQIFKCISPTDHPNLYSHINTPAARRRIIQHLRKTIYISFIKDLYEEVTEYFRYILKQGAKSIPEKGRLVGNIKLTLNANEILSANSHDEIIESVTNKLFQELENQRSTTQLIKQISSKLGLDICESLQTEAMPYLLLRHIFVHSDGKPDRDFKASYGSMFSLDNKGRISLQKQHLNEAKSKVDALITAFDQAMIKKNYFEHAELQH